MTRKANSKNTNYYHFRVDFYDGEKKIKSKYYHVADEICDELNTSSFTVYKMIKQPEYKHKKNKLLHTVKIFRDRKPVRQYIETPTEIEY